MKTRIGRVIVGIAVLAGAQAGQARFAHVTEPAPVERLVDNVARYVREHPTDAAGYYTLGRIHSLAFARGTATIEVVPAGSRSPEGKPNLPGFAGYESVQQSRDISAGPVTTENLTHLRESVRNYARATELAPKSALYFLGLGWMLEQGASYAAQAGAPWETDSAKAARKDVKPTVWRDRALAAYRQAYALSIDADSKQAHFFASGGDVFISLEAGQGILRLQTWPGRTLSDHDKAEIEQVQDAIAKLKKKPMVVTPILVPLGRDTSLQGLLAPGKSVTFDLAGDDQPARWPWVGPDAGILVWDPQHTGHITSGRQLFGSVTWWIFWGNGYQAMAALDDNGDGWLTGHEMAGLALWRDANGNGVSEPGEVKPPGEWDIEALATSATAQTEGVPANPTGCRLRDGRVLPTYDWTPQPVAP